MFAPILTVYIFPMVIMSQSLNPLISRQKPNCFGYAGLYGLNNYVSPLNSKASKFELHHYHDWRMCFICFVVPSGISWPQAKYWMDFHSIITWSNHSFPQWWTFTAQHLVLLSLCKALNLILASIQRKNLLVKLKMRNKKRKRNYGLLYGSKSDMHLYIWYASYTS